MESNYHPSRDEAAAALNSLSSDRHRLATSIRTPWAFPVTYGALAALWVAGAVATQPGADYQARGPITLLAVGAMAVTYLLRHTTGIRFRSIGPRAAWSVLGVLALCLTLFSVSLGLVAFGLPWAVLVTAAAAFVGTMWLARRALRFAVEALRA